MRRATIAGLILLSLIGCAQLKGVVSNIKDCITDLDCRSHAEGQAKEAKAIAVSVAGVSPIPLSANLVGGVTFGLVFLFNLAKGKKKEE